MNKLIVILLIVTAWSCNQSPSEKPVAKDGYDVVILNGRVMDPESGLDAIRNVGITGNTIKAITEESILGKETIDATDHVIAPGFIDTHAHGLDPFSQKMYARDGMTSAMDTELGTLDFLGSSSCIEVADCGRYSNSPICKCLIEFF